MIGQGSYGVVVKARSMQTKQLVAIKHIQVESEYQYALVKVVRELQIMQYLNNSIPKKSGLKESFASLLDFFSPADEMARKSVRNLFLVMPLS